MLSKFLRNYKKFFIGVYPPHEHFSISAFVATNSVFVPPESVFVSLNDETGRGKARAASGM